MFVPAVVVSPEKSEPKKARQTQFVTKSLSGGGYRIAN